MSVLLLRLAAPMQSWGDSSRFVRRGTRHEPTKSGVLGLIAAAQGRRRVDAIADLAELTFGVRTDQPGRLVRDFQTAIRVSDGARMPLSYRYYIADGVFVAGVQGDNELLAGIDESLRSPIFPLYLGRRSCPPTGAVSLGLRNGELVDALRAEEWHASRWYQRTIRSAQTVLDIHRDAVTADEAGVVVRDTPLSFDPTRRQYTWRTVVRESRGAVVDNLEFRAAADGSDHEPFSVLGGA